MIEPFSYYAFLFLGSDGMVRFKLSYTKNKLNEITVQHGDVIGFKAGDQPIEVILRTDTFGFGMYEFTPHDLKALI